MKTIEQLDTLPDSVLTDLTGERDTPGAAAEPGQSDTDIFDTGKGAENSHINNTVDIPGAVNEPGFSAAIPKTRPISAGAFVSGEFATNLMDTIVPSLILLLALQFGYLFEKKSLQLTSKEKELIAPAMQEYLDSLNVNFNNPLYNLLFVVGAVYATKVIDILPSIKKKQSVPKKEQDVSDKEVIEKKVQDEQQRAKKRQDEIKLLKTMSRPVAIKWLTENRKYSKATANEWYQKNIA